jgi:hypothetical protein
MKNYVIVLAAAAVALTFPAGAAADGPFDYAVGAGERPTVPGLGGARDFAFSAHETTEGVIGHLDLRFSAFPEFSGHVNAEVECLFVVANETFIAGIVRHSTHAGFPEGTGVAMAFEDNGPPVGGVPVDRASLNFTNAPPPETEAECAALSAFAPILFATLVPITSGNVEIYDAPG